MRVILKLDGHLFGARGSFASVIDHALFILITRDADNRRVSLFLDEDGRTPGKLWVFDVDMSVSLAHDGVVGPKCPKISQDVGCVFCGREKKMEVRSPIP